MREVGAFEAKTHLPELLRDVERGESIRITNRGRPVARLVPDYEGGLDTAQTIDPILELRRGKRLGPGPSLKDMIEKGRM
ncbi:type II toxin-antitoxin system Phd/YefM family antitoxin [Arenibaculum pallidiluteum]|uniref:type II toxin-antitoxin system Phd/YefM family antitoxin n=1 Tax=Arenibaculum pallidiluteum TaxID=2812559 RepID=UPI001A97B525|nr:type II toxin-antitoxin system prevent-host-death family antitoxin [Arenibaculum pallidiluteum]